MMLGDSPLKSLHFRDEVKLLHTLVRHEVTIDPSEEEKKDRQAMLREDIWSLESFMDAASEELLFCPYLCRTWRL